MAKDIITLSDRKKFNKAYELYREVFQNSPQITSYSDIKYYSPILKKLRQLSILSAAANNRIIPYSILKQVYNRGMAAWRGGHRPGTTQVQWALARVNSFVTKSSGTWGGADKDLAKQVRGSK